MSTPNTPNTSNDTTRELLAVLRELIDADRSLLAGLQRHHHYGPAACMAIERVRAAIAKTEANQGGTDA